MALAKISLYCTLNNSNKNTIKKSLFCKQYLSKKQIRYLLNKYTIIQNKLDKVSNELPSLTHFSPMFHFYVTWKCQNVGDFYINQLIEIPNFYEIGWVYLDILKPSGKLWHKGITFMEFQEAY